MSDFRGPRAKIVRARNHIESLAAQEQAFFARSPFEEFKEQATAEVHGVMVQNMRAHKVRIKEPIPDEAACTAADALSNLRSALDLAACDCARAAGNEKVKEVRFPFVDKANNLRSSPKVKLLPVETIEVIEKLQPWPPDEGGNKLLFALNRIRNLDVHELLTPVALRSKSMEIGHIHLIKVIHFKLLNPHWDHEKNETTLFITGPFCEFTYDLKLNMLATFGNVEVVPFAPLIATLRELLSAVEEAVKLLAESTSQRS